MLALLLAAQLSAGTAQPTLHRRDFIEPPRVCAGAGVTLAARPGPASLLRPGDRKDARPRRLGDLPSANHELAVLRSVAGCTVPVVVRYDVEARR